MTRACFNNPAAAATYVLGDWDRAAEKWTAKSLTLVSQKTDTRHLLHHGNLPPALEVWHEGRCGRCGRKLTTPQSVETGFGPVCAQNL